MPLEPEQDYDLNGDRSNSYTRAEAREMLAKRTDLTAEERKWWENRTQCLRGDPRRKRATLGQTTKENSDSAASDQDSLQKVALPNGREPTVKGLATTTTTRQSQRHSLLAVSKKPVKNDLPEAKQKNQQEKNSQNLVSLPASEPRWKKNECRLDRLQAEKQEIDRRLAGVRNSSSSQRFADFLLRRQEIELRIKQQQVAADLYACNPQTEQARHGMLEKKYNDLGRQVHQLAKKKGEFHDKHDHRHEFTFESQRFKVFDGSFRREETVTFPLHPATHTINWRQTDIGSKEDAKLRGAARMDKQGDGDAAGHRIALSFGPDPAEQRNIAPQNSMQNAGGGTWYAVENRLRLLAKKHPDGQLRIQVRETFHDQKYGTNRAIKRTIVVKDANGRIVAEKNLIFANNTWKAERKVSLPSGITRTVSTDASLSRRRTKSPQRQHVTVSREAVGKRKPTEAKQAVSGAASQRSKKKTKTKAEIPQTSSRTNDSRPKKPKGPRV